MSDTSSSHEPTGSKVTSADAKSIIIGIYGISGCGKSYLMEEIKNEVGERNFAFFEGSTKISQLVEGGLDAFKNMGRAEQDQIRERAIDGIQMECAEKGKAGIVAGHYMLWSEGDTEGQVVWTEADGTVFTHIIYMDVFDVAADVFRRGDTSKHREEASVEHIRKWKEAEEAALRTVCGKHRILFARLVPSQDMKSLSKVLPLLHAFSQHSEQTNTAQAERALDMAWNPGNRQLKNFLVMDADKTLTSEDSGNLFWDTVRLYQTNWKETWTPTQVFRSSLGYSYEAFRQTNLLCEEALDDAGFREYCAITAGKVNLYPEFISLLRRVGRYEHVGAIIITSGLRLVWEKVLDREGLADTVKVIGGGRLSDAFVVTRDVKAALTARLRDVHKLKLWAFGDSPLDLGMLGKANEAIVVVGKEEARSASMEQNLDQAIKYDGLDVRQVLFPATVKPRLDLDKVPSVKITDSQFIESIFGPGLELIDATSKGVTMLLKTPMRNADVAGTALRKVHRQTGWYLANEFLSEVIGLEQYEIRNVHGNSDEAYRLLEERETIIVALMRGGEPMAFGVNNAFPLASFLHAKTTGDIKPEHLEGKSSVILVDSVVNTGKSAVEFIERVLKLNPHLRIVIVAGVVQIGAVSENSALAKVASKKHLMLVTLRFSGTKFTGKGPTDTGNRLFNTTFLD